MVDKTGSEQMETMEGTEAILRKFGDDQSTLLDQFERLSFEIQLNQAILARSLSEPCVPRTSQTPPLLLAPPPMASRAPQGRQQQRQRGLGFRKILKRLLKPILLRRKGVSDPKDPKSWKAFSRSMRV